MSTHHSQPPVHSGALAVVGAGAVGTYFAAQWAEAGLDVTLCVRREFEDLVVDSETHPVRRPVQVVTDPAAVGPCATVVLAVKTHQTPGARGWLESLCGPGTTLVVLQNGVEGRERVQPLAPEATVVPAVVYCSAERVAPGHVRHDGMGSLMVPDSEPGRAFASRADVPGSAVTATAAFATEGWRKLGANVAVNGPTALTDRTTEVVTDPGIADLVRSLVAECWQVGAAEGAEVDPEEALGMVQILAERPPVGTSMLYDRRAGTATEHDALYGAVLRCGERHGVQTPVTRMVEALLAAGDPTAGAR